MESENGKIWFEYGIKSDMKGVNQIQDAFNKIVKDVESGADKLDESFKNLGKGGVAELGKQFESALEKQKAKIAEVEQEASKFETVLRNMGNTKDPYMLQETEKAKKVLAGTYEELDKLYAKYDVLDKAVKKYNDAVENSNSVAHSYQTQMRLLREEMTQIIELSEENGTNYRENAHYKELEDELRKVGQAYRIVQQEQKDLIRGGGQLQGLVQGISGLSGAFSAFTGVSALFVEDNEKLVAIQTKLQSVMAITIGLQQVSTALSKTSAFQTQILSKVTGAYTASMAASRAAVTAGTVANVGLAASLRAIGAAIKAIPVVGWALAAISALVAILPALTKKSREAKKANEEFAKSVADMAAKSIADVNRLASEWKKLSTLEEKKKFIDSNKKAFDELGVSIKNVLDAENLLINNKDKFIESVLLKAKAEAYREKAISNYKKKLPEVDKAFEEYDKLYKKEFQAHAAERYRKNPNESDFIIERTFNPSDKLKKLKKNWEDLNKTMEEEAGKLLKKSTEAAEAAGNIFGTGTKNNATTFKEDLKQVNEEIQKYKNTLQSLENAKELNIEIKGGYAVTKEAAEKGLKEAEERKKVLLGINDKEIETRKAAYEKVLELIKEGEFKVAQNRINLMQDGLEKTLAQIELNKQKEKEAINKAEKELIKENKTAGKTNPYAEYEQIEKDMVSKFGKGNVDLLARPMIDALELINKKWVENTEENIEDLKGQIATLYSSQWGIEDKNGNVVELLVTPITPDGKLLSEEELSDYIHNVLEGAEDILKADTKGLVIKIGADEKDGEILHELQEKYFDILKNNKPLMDYYELRRQAEEKANKETLEAKKANAKAIETLGKEMTDWQLSEEDRRANAIKEKYEKIREEYKKLLGEDAFNLLSPTIDEQETKELYADLLEKYASFEQQKTKIVEHYNAERKRIEISNNSDEKKQSMLAELEKQKKEALKVISDKELEIARKNSDLLVKIFSDVSNQSTKRIKESIDLIKQLFAYFKGGALPDGISQEIADKIKETPEELKALYDQLLALQDKYNEKFNFPLGNFAKGFKHLKEAGEYTKAALNAATDKERELNDEAAKGAMDKGIRAVGAGAAEFAGYLQEACGYMKQIAEITGDDKLANTADKLSAFAQNLSAAGQGAASGGWVGAIVGGGMDMIKQTMEAVIQAKSAAKLFEQERLDFVYKYKMALLDLKKEDYSSIFGEDAFKKIRLAADNAKTAMDGYKDYITKRTMPEIEKEAASLGTAIFQPSMLLGLGYVDFFGLIKTETNKYKTEMEAFKKGYTDLEGMAINTTNYTGWAKFWGKKDEYTSLKDLHPELFEDSGFLNVDAAKAFLETTKGITEEQRKMLEQAIEQSEKYEEMVQAIKDDLQDTFGHLGTAAVDAIFNSIRNGTDAWDEFKKAGVQALDTLGKKITYSLYFSKLFDELDKKLTDLALDGNLSAEEIANQQMEAMNKFFNEDMPEAFKGAMTFAEQWNEKMKAAGFDADELDRKAQQKGFAAMTQDSANELNASFGVLRVLTAEIKISNQIIADNTSKMLTSLEDINYNTKRLERIETDMSKMYGIFNSGKIKVTIV